MRMMVVAVAGLALAGDAFAGDKGACRKARREMTIDAWTKYVLDHPEGVCKDEALGQMIVLGIGRVASGLAGDPTKLALAMAQLGHMSDADFQSFRDLMGGLGGLGGLGGGLGGLGGLGGGGLGGLGSLGDYGADDGGISSLFGSGMGEGDYGALLGSLEGGGVGGALGALGGGEDQIYVGFSVVSTSGGWDNDAFYGALDEARFGLQDCWKAKGLPLVSVSYDVAFEVKAGKPSVKTVAMTYSSDGAPHAPAEECVRAEIGKLAIPAEYTGAYTYRVEFY